MTYAMCLLIMLALLYLRVGCRPRLIPSGNDGLRAARFVLDPKSFIDSIVSESIEEAWKDIPELQRSLAIALSDRDQESELTKQICRLLSGSQVNAAVVPIEISAVLTCRDAVAGQLGERQTIDEDRIIVDVISCDGDMSLLPGPGAIAKEECVTKFIYVSNKLAEYSTAEVGFVLKEVVAGSTPWPPRQWHGMLNYVYAEGTWSCKSGSVEVAPLVNSK